MPKSVLVLFDVQITNITLSFPGQKIIFPNFNPDARIYNIKKYICIYRTSCQERVRDGQTINILCQF